jgi:GR25 family glycosyltransferase involved in LPS biosynthesis
MYGAVLASTMTSLAVSGAMKYVNSIHLVLADDRMYNMSLVYNMRNMPAVHTHVATAAGIHEPPSSKLTYLAALHAPDNFTTSDLPSIIIEDDVWFSDKFPERLAEIMMSAKQQSGDAPYFVSLYHIDSGNIAVPEQVRARHMSLGPPKHQTSNQALPIGYVCCTQANFYSTGSLRRQLASFYKTQMRVPSLGDMPVVDFLRKHKVHQYYPSISLVQHIGTSSAIFNDGGKPTNQRFHRAPTFPFMEMYVTDDKLMHWFY